MRRRGSSPPHHPAMAGYLTWSRSTVMSTCSQRLSLMPEPANLQMRIAPGAQLVPAEQLRDWLAYAGSTPDLTHTARHSLCVVSAHIGKAGPALVSAETI